MTGPRAALSCVAGDDVSLCGYTLTDMKGVTDVSADLDDLSCEFMADHDGRLYTALSPLIPVGDVEVGSADACVVHLDHHVGEAACGFGDVGEN